MRAQWVGGLPLMLAAVLGACAPEADPNLVDVSATDFTPHTTTARLAAAGTVTIAVTGNDVDESNVPAGFESELGRMIAGALGIADHEISWVQTDALNHERLLEDGHVDLVIAAMPMTERSLEIVDFAGPYYVGDMGMLAASTGSDAERVCATAEIGHLVDAPDTVGTLQDCMQRLTDGTADAVVAPDLVLAPEADSGFDLGAAGIGSLSYGVGVAKGDDDLRGFITDVLITVAQDGRWAAAWASTLEPVLGPAEPPPVQRSG